jgi:ParB family chromosome partitioning protein
MISVDRIVASPYQPRREFDEQALSGLADSIRSAGIMQPVLVRGSQFDRFELIAGERRWRAARLAGLIEIPAVIVSISDVEAAEWALIENVQREDLGPIERALAYRNLSERFGLSHAQIGEKLGIDRTAVTNYIRLLELDPSLQDYIVSDRLSVGHGKVLLGLEDGVHRLALGERAAKEHWSVRRLEREIELARAGVVSRRTPTSSERSLATREIEKQLSDQLGTKVQVVTKSGGKKGRLMIEFYSLDHFDGLMTRMGVKIGV